MLSLTTPAPLPYLPAVPRGSLAAVVTPEDPATPYHGDLGNAPPLSTYGGAGVNVYHAIVSGAGITVNLTLGNEDFSYGLYPSGSLDPVADDLPTLTPAAAVALAARVPLAAVNDLLTGAAGVTNYPGFTGPAAPVVPPALAALGFTRTN